jgi:hypothetical protein
MISEDGKVEEHVRSGRLSYRMKLLTRKWLVVGAGLMLTACATIGPPLPPSLDLPKSPSDLRAVRKGDRVTLTWTVPTTTTDRQRARSFGATRICRGSGELTQCGPSVGEAIVSSVGASKSPDQKNTGTFTDVWPTGMAGGDASGFVTYAVEARNADGRSAGLSNQVRVPLVPTLPPVTNFAAEITAQGVLLSWAVPPPLGRVPPFRCLFRIYRRAEGGATADKIADLGLPNCMGFSKLLSLDSQNQRTKADEDIPDSYLDQTFEWEKTYFYCGTVVSVVGEPGKPAAEVEGENTLEVKVFAHDVFPPSVPAGLQAVFSGPGQKPFIDLVWAPVTDVDLAGYDVYRHEEGGPAGKINAELVKAPAYRDFDAVSGKHYSYSVSAVDVRGNESARSEEAGESAP